MMIYTAHGHGMERQHCPGYTSSAFLGSRSGDVFALERMSCPCRTCSMLQTVLFTMFSNYRSDAQSARGLFFEHGR